MRLTWPFFTPATKTRRWGLRLVAGLSLLFGMPAIAATAANPWAQPAASLADQIAGILGPGQARLTVRNLSTIANDEIPAIRRLLDDDLKAHGVMASDEESANAVRVTLSENARERLWIAEVVEGNETQVVMVHVDPDLPRQAQPGGTAMMLRKQTLITLRKPVLAVLETPNGLVTLEPDQVVIFAHAAGGWSELRRVRVGQGLPLPRDPRGALLASGKGFEAWFAGMHCEAIDIPTDAATAWPLHCHQSDDPWQIAQAPPAQIDAAADKDAPVTPVKAFYNAARNYFTGAVTSGLGADLPPFYSAALLQRPLGGAALLISSIDGKVQVAENGVLKPVAGTRDWGSDFAELHSNCGAGTQIIASGSGEAASDSLRAYELPAQEAVPASAPLSMGGSVTTLWTGPDGKSIFAVVHVQSNAGEASQYEVDRVTASCN